MSEPSKSERSVWRTGYVFALLSLFLLGISFIVIGAGLFLQGSFLNVLFIGAGIAMAPTAVIATLFRIFLFKEVQYQLTQPVVESIREVFQGEMEKQVGEVLRDYRIEIENFGALREAGLIRSYRRRRDALEAFAPHLASEENEIMVVGSSLKGLLIHEDYERFSRILRQKIEDTSVRVKFLLTHPVFADQRAFQEGRVFTEIGAEILCALGLLEGWGQPVELVRLYRGTPTCFALKTRRMMVLNPYPYKSVAFDSPCLLVEAGAGGGGYFYNAFDRDHFGAWDTAVAQRVEDYQTTIRDLEGKLEEYAEKMRELAGS